MPVGHDSNNPQMNIAISDPNKLVAWLNNSDRIFLVLRNEDLVRSLPLFKEGIEVVQQLVSCYRDHRRLQATGLFEEALVNDHVTDRRVPIRMPIMKDELLEPEELDELIEWAQRQKTEALKRRAAKHLVP